MNVQEAGGIIFGNFETENSSAQCCGECSQCADCPCQDCPE